MSGGADSTALLLILADLAEELGIVLHIAHFDHRTRPRQSAEDADFVARLANRVGAPIRVGRAERAMKSEEDARRARYAFLRRAAEQIGATAIATGHTRDDQAETVLLHLARGSGLAGLAGMRPFRDRLARPLLCIGRTETRAVCRDARIRPRTDPTNRALRYARNRVRLEVIPELAKINPRVAEAIARLADAAAALEGSQRAAAETALESATRGGAIDLDALAQGDDAMEALSLAWRRATGTTLDARHRAALARLAGAREGSRAIDLPGGRAVREYGTLRIETGDAPQRTDGAVRLVSGETLTWNGWRIAFGSAIADGDATVADVPEKLLRRLVVRAREDGDRTRESPRRKLQDLFTDAKVPLRWRSRWPVIASREGVFWVPFVTVPPKSAGGTRLAVAAPKQIGNVLWDSRVREVASNRTGSGGPTGKDE